MLIGELRRFEQNGHSFVLGHRGYGMLGQFLLSMDGKDWAGARNPSSQARSIWRPLPCKYVKGMHAPGEAAAPAPQPPPAASVQFVKELSCTESDEVVGEEEYPLDNRFGSSAFSTDRQVSRESTNELSVDVTKDVSGNAQSAKSCPRSRPRWRRSSRRQTGCKIGEKVTESQTLHFSVAAEPIGFVPGGVEAESAKRRASLHGRRCSSDRPVPGELRSVLRGAHRGAAKAGLSVLVHLLVANRRFAVIPITIPQLFFPAILAVPRHSGGARIFCYGIPNSIVPAACVAPKRCARLSAKPG